MKTNLELLIEHVQAEFDYLKSSMDECIREWDFNGAKAFRKPLTHTSRKLNILKCLKNPLYTKISRLTYLISKLEKRLDEQESKLEYFDEQSRIRMEQYFKETRRKRIEKSKIELDGLLSIIPEKCNDNDKILELLDDLERNEISEIEFEIRKERIFLLLRVDESHGEFILKSADNQNVKDFLVEPTTSILRKLGFDLETFTLQISNFTRKGKVKLLEELAIIYFEVFSVFGEEVNIKIDRSRDDIILSFGSKIKLYFRL